MYDKVFETLSTSLTMLGDNEQKRTKAVADILELIKPIPMDITTVFLLLAAIRNQVKAGVVKSTDEELADDIDEYYLIDKKHKKEQKHRLKLVKSDSEAFSAILDGNEGQYIQGSNVTQNFLSTSSRSKCR